jgi:hypothetical protein
MTQNKLNMNVLLSFNNMFKWRGPLDIKWNNLFGYPNRTWTLFLWLLSFFWFYNLISFFNLANILQVFNLKFAQNELVQNFPMLAHFIQLLLYAHNSIKFCFEVKLNSMPLQFPKNFENIFKNMIFFPKFVEFYHFTSILDVLHLQFTTQQVYQKRHPWVMRKFHTCFKCTTFVFKQYKFMEKKKLHNK